MRHCFGSRGPMGQVILIIRAEREGRLIGGQRMRESWSWNGLNVQMRCIGLVINSLIFGNENDLPTLIK
jgi:hypothetical protein